MNPSTRDRILELFEKHRVTPGAQYDDDHFLDFLLESPKQKRVVYNSFRGLRRFNAFLDEVQYEFAVCFSMKDRDANYPVDKFVNRVQELQKSRRSSLKSLNNQFKAGAGWQVLVVADFIIFIVAVWLQNSLWAMFLVVALAIVINLWFILFAKRSKVYLVRLRDRIEQFVEQ
jgi:hypothetical protein